MPYNVSLLTRGRLSLRIILPAVVCLILFIAATFLLFLPFLEDSIMSHKRETIRELTKTTLGILETYHAREQTGELTRSDAQARAARHIRSLRYGPESKDYFWINDMHPYMIMHPYRPDLEGTDISDFRDPNGKRLFSAFVQKVRESGSGYVDYMWQWKDDPEHIVPKLSYVEGFEPWGWILGTGIYIEDVRLEIGAIRNKLAFFSILILLAVAVLTGFIIHQSLMAEAHRHKLVKALAENEALFRHHFENSAVGIARTSLDGHFLSLNSAMARILGFDSPEEVVSHAPDISALYLDQHKRNELVELVKEHQVVTGFIVKGARRDGVKVFLEINSKGQFNDQGELVSLENVILDVTQRVRALEALGESEERHRTLVETTPHGVNEIDASGRIVMANAAQHEMLGYGPDELLGSCIWDLKPPHARERMRNEFKRIIADEPKPGFIQTRDMRKDGALVDVLAAWNYRRDKNGKVTGLMSVITDISELKRNEEELRSAKEQAEAANHAKSEFLANMSHEIRTPLNGIVGMLQLMQTTELDEEQEEYAQAAIQSSRRLTRLLSDILDLSRVEAGKLQVVAEPFDPAETVRQVAELFQVMSKQTGVDLNMRIDPNVPERVEGDSARLQQILNNLVGNAFKFTPSGHVSMDVTALPTTNSGTRNILFTVSDTGIGIPEDKLGMLFEPFTQAGEGFAKKYQGAGLGLAICKRLVLLMGGEITVSSEPGSGTSVCFNIPFKAARGLPATAAEPAEAASLSTPQLNVLLAEDDEVSSFTAVRQLEKAGCAVTAVKDGLQAVNELKANDYDVVLMDVQMPVMDGVEATLAIRQGAAGDGKSNIPIIAVTAYAMNGDRERFLHAGMNGYVSKPVEAQKLREALAQAAAAVTGQS